ncbi:MAG: hypothetical protein K5694_06165 [Bacilli bacterium]|nr:hypothetical protein [Bacilli bacterium]
MNKYIVRGISLPLEHDNKAIKRRIAKMTRLSLSDFSFKILRKSLDCRRNSVFYIYSAAIETDLILNENDFRLYEEPKPLVINKREFKERPVIVGFGPAGMYCALILARAGARPIILERGKDVVGRAIDIENLQKNAVLNTESNVCYGEGGAGTFSDGKLHTGVSDPHSRFVLDEFVKHGAPKEILIDAQPHIGSDNLKGVVKSFREEIESLGGDILFSSRFEEIVTDGLKVTGLKYIDSDGFSHEIKTEHVVLAIGHSPYDTMKNLVQNGVKIEPKDFSIGVRIEHLQRDIDINSYHNFAKGYGLPASSYKAVAHLENGRSLYSFCMCPGGFVMNSSTDLGGIVTNGMSNHDRSNVNGNAALLVNVRVGDFYNGHPLDGFIYRRSIEEKAFNQSKPYFAPIQKVGDFLSHRQSETLGEVKPSYMPGVYFGDLHRILPKYVAETLLEGLPLLGNRQKFFQNSDAIMVGVETRSSSPVRIPRNDEFQSNIWGLFPIGEGASYAGGITTAALDGVKIATFLIKN